MEILLDLKDEISQGSPESDIIWMDYIIDKNTDGPFSKIKDINNCIYNFASIRYRFINKYETNIKREDGEGRKKKEILQRCLSSLYILQSRIFNDIEEPQSSFDSIEDAQKIISATNIWIPPHKKDEWNKQLYQARGRLAWERHRAMVLANDEDHQKAIRQLYVSSEQYLNAECKWKSFYIAKYRHICFNEGISWKEFLSFSNKEIDNIYKSGII